MSERERLIELKRAMKEDVTITCPRYVEGATLKNCRGCRYDMEDGSCDYTGREVDYLLANGVIVPPCKVGDTVYWIDENSIKYGLVTSIQMNSDETRFTALTDDLEEMEFEDFEIGNAIFPTQEEAEEALRGWRNNII